MVAFRLNNSLFTGALRMSRSFYVLKTKRSKRRMLPSVNFVHATNTTEVPVSPCTTASTATNRNKNGNSDSGNVVTHTQRPIYVAATRQHCGKTTVCLALMSGLRKRFPHVGFMKPVGQQYVLAPAPGSSDGDSGSSSTVPIDKDVVLMKNHFRLDDADYKLMSPIIVQRGYVKDYIDGKIHHKEQLARIQEAYTRLAKSNDIVLCEGTGHVAVGSVLGLNNAQVAKLIGANMVLVTNGGIGSSFDDLELNRLVCEHYGVNIAGVIINKVKPDKVDQTRDYMTRALSQLNLPVLGCVPDRPFLGCVALADLERLFGVQLISGSDQRMKHYSYEDMKVVQINDLNKVQEKLRNHPPRTMYFVHYTRDDIVMAFLEEYERRKWFCQTFESALMICSPNINDISSRIRDIIAGQQSATINNNKVNTPPIMVLPCLARDAISMINKYTPKLNADDSNRVSKAIEHYEPFIDFDMLLERTKVVLDPDECFQRRSESLW